MLYVEEIMSKSPWWLNLLVKTLLVDLVIALFALGWSWLTKDSSLISLSNRFFLGGAIAILVSLASGMGNWENRASWQQMLARSAGASNLNERNQQMLAEMTQVYSLSFVMIPAGAIAILVAVLVGQLT
jgi:hypothetical protein